MTLTGSPSKLYIRALTENDMPAAVALSSGAGWNQTAGDWLMLIRLAPETCFALEYEGQLAATTTLLCYGRQLAWVGMVLTRPDYQGRGFARRLVEHAVTQAEYRKIETLKLDATEQGLPLYEKLGFRMEQAIERWSGAGMRPLDGGDTPRQLSLHQIEHLDRESFGADRSRLLRALANYAQPLSQKDGFLFSRPGFRASYLGPCVASSADTARTLIGNCLQSAAGYWFWDILASNAAASALASELGFKSVRRLARMSRGVQRVSDASKIYAVAGFEIG